MKRKLIGAIKLLIGLAASGGLGWLTARGLDWDLVLDALEGVSLSLVLLSVVVFMAACYLRALRWQVLFVNDKISAARLFIIQNEGIGLNNVMPVRVASEPTQLAILTLREGVKAATALATLGMERVIDVIASALILAIAFFLVPEMKNFTVYVWGAIGFSIVAVAAVRFLAWGSEAVGFIRRFSFPCRVRHGRERPGAQADETDGVPAGQHNLLGYDRYNRMGHRNRDQSTHLADDGHPCHHGHYLFCDRGACGPQRYRNIRVRCRLRAGIFRRGTRGWLWIRDNHPRRILPTADHHSRDIPSLRGNRIHSTGPRNGCPRSERGDRTVLLTEWPH